MAVEIEERVPRLEAIYGEFVASVGAALLRMERGMETLQREMQDFKNEARLENRRMNQKWREIAHRLGTMVEDLVYPSMERIILEQFGLETDNLMVRIKRKLKSGERREFDAVALAGNLMFLNSTKSTLKKQHVDEFVNDIPVFRTYFPEYQERKLIGILAALYIDESVLKYAQKKGFLVLGVGDEIMEVKNDEGFKPKRW